MRGAQRSWVDLVKSLQEQDADNMHEAVRRSIAESAKLANAQRLSDRTIAMKLNMREPKLVVVPTDPFGDCQFIAVVNAAGLNMGLLQIATATQSE